MARYVERNKVIELFKRYQPTLAINVCEFGDELEKLPTEDVAPIIRGKWEDTATEIDKKYHRHSLICKNCLKSATYFVCGTEDWWCVELPRYCPNCGAKMEESE